MQMVLTGVITGAGKQAASGPILVVGYWVLGLPFGAACAFAWPWNERRSLGLLGLWLGMTLAVTIHSSAYMLVCFAPCRMRGVIQWGDVIDEARRRLDATASTMTSSGGRGARRGAGGGAAATPATHARLPLAPVNTLASQTVSQTADRPSKDCDWASCP